MANAADRADDIFGEAHEDQEPEVVPPGEDFMVPFTDEQLAALDEEFLSAKWVCGGAWRGELLTARLRQWQRVASCGSNFQRL